MRDLKATTEPKARKGPGAGGQPEWIYPMLAVLTARRFSDERWIYERKLDGERCLVFRGGDKINIMSRNKKALNDTYPDLIKAIKKVKRNDFIVDGEIVAFEGKATSFAKLQKRMQVKKPDRKLLAEIPVTLYIFDVLYLNGRDLTGRPLFERKEALERNFYLEDPLRLLTFIRKKGEEYHQAACHKGWEGVIAKRLDSIYRSGRSEDWLKFKCSNQQEFVIGGFTDPMGSRVGFGALLIGFYENGKLKFAGKVGTGFNAELLRKLTKRLKEIERKESPFANDITGLRGVHWVKPVLVAQIAFTEWTEDGKLRHPRFVGIRRDKDPKEVIREIPRA
jgi:DNA ligase D-like protein (predicted ligase)